MLEYDEMKTLPGGSLLQEGPYSDRVYLMKLAEADADTIVEALDKIAREKNRSKIFVKVPEKYRELFFKKGYEEEAKIPRLFCEEDGLFLAKYLSEERRRDDLQKESDDVLFQTQKKAVLEEEEANPEISEELTEKDVQEMSRIYQAVFPTYPFPIQDISYLQKTMQEHIKYFGVRKESFLVALSSAEIDREASHAEMTDFATLPGHRKKGYAANLLAKMEKTMQTDGIQTVFTIARALSPGANMIFKKRNYKFAGTLFNNTQIAGKIESMNVWYKHLS